MAWQEIALGAALVLLGVAARSELRRRRVRAHFRRAAQAERAAASLLRRAGYRVVEVQPEHHIRFRFGGRLLGATVRADYLVRRRLRTYVVEVKSGERAPDPSCRATRRQLREYCAVFPYPVLLLDASSGSLERIEFLDADAGRGLVAAALRLGVCLALWWLAAELWAGA
jgi:hypothetical protein